MARRAIEVSLALLLLAALCAPSSAQTPGGCTPVLSSLAPCISYVVGNSSTPTSVCCSQLANLLQTQTQCICVFLTGGITQLGFVFNQTQALTLPGACKIRMSSANPCTGITASAPAAAPTMPAAAPTPAAAPATTPAPSVPTISTPSVPSAPVPSGSGSKTTTETSMARSSAKFTPALFFFFLLVVASYA